MTYMNACRVELSLKSYSPSYVLVAMGIDSDTIENSVRISWGPDTNLDDVKKMIAELLKVAKQIKS